VTTDNPAYEIVWTSVITRGMVADWTDEEIELLSADLDDAVQSTYEDWELR
jgi:hypothetical protein